MQADRRYYSEQSFKYLRGPLTERTDSVQILDFRNSEFKLI